MKTITLTSGDGAEIHLYWAPAQQFRATLLVQPALGIQAKLYRPLAEGLAQHGCGTAILEQRGHGLSQLRPGYRSTYSMRETLDHDVPAAMRWLAEQAPDAQRLIGGHSLGGHLSTIYTGQHAADIDGVVLLACAFPYLQDYSGKQRRMLRLLCTLIPLFTIAPGYYPGHLLGFGEKESLAMMKQWRQWAVSGRFDFDDRTGLAEAVAAYSGPVLAINFERDQFSTAAAAGRALSPYTGASIDRFTLGEREQGDYLGHTGWAREPAGTVAAIAAWLERVLPSA